MTALANTTLTVSTWAIGAVAVVVTLAVACLLAIGLVAAAVHAYERVRAWRARRVVR